MAVWRKVIVSGSQAHLQAVTASISIDTPGAIGFVGTGSWAIYATTASYITGSVFTSGNPALSASYALTASYALNVSTPTLVTSASVVQVFDVSTDNNTYYPTFVKQTSGHPSQSIDTNLTYNPSNDTLTLGSIAVNSGSITTTATTFTIASTNATAITIGGTGATVIVPGNLAVNGTTTFINTENVLVKDRFILLNSGSASGEGGIVVQQTADFSGSAFYWHDANDRWSLTLDVAANATTATPNSYVVSVSGSSADPTGDPTYGGATNGYGNMYVNTTSGDIWIYS